MFLNCPLDNNKICGNCGTHNGDLYCGQIHDSEENAKIKNMKKCPRIKERIVVKGKGEIIIKRPLKVRKPVGLDLFDKTEE